ncbi:uncharacterized protein [Aquarana catesbeiana]|uniref:uncharacterized protein isoform X2 n=1 Tax=Aquarana catesbeiana TaxID=8400 RepID=UPI003CCA1DF9
MITHVLLLLCLLQSGWALNLSAQKAMMGKDVNIPCSFTVKNLPIDRRYLSIIWSFQGKEILSVQNAAVKSTDPRMSYTSRAEDGIADLSISNINITDRGIYKCFIQYRSETEEKEIRLDVQAPPQINITDNVIVKNKESSLRSVISGFYPMDIDIKWLRDGETLDKVIVETPQKDLDGMYSVRSSVTITPTEEDRERTFSCRVQHKSLTAPLQEDFQLVYGDIPSVHITSQAFWLNVQQNLVCSVSGFYPESITVNWFLNDTLVEKAKTRRISSSNVESVYFFTPTQQNWDMELRCVVEHGTLTTPHMERLLVQAPDLEARYKLHVVLASVALILITGPLIIVLLFNKQRRKRFPKVRNITRSSGGTFSLDVHHFYPEKITVSWEVIKPPSSTQPHPIESTIIITQNQDGTFNATSTCESLRGLINENEVYVVRAVVEHRKLKHVKRREWRSDDKDNKDFLARPEVGMIRIPKLFVNKHTQLQCTISQFYPDDLTVNWLMKDMGKREFPITNSGRYKMPDSRSQLQPDKTFTHTALLEFTPLLEDVGSEVICRVSHPSLKEPIEKTTGPLQVLATPELQQPIQLSVTDSGDVVGCLTLINFYPQDITVNWTCNPIQYKENMPENKVIGNQNGTFRLDSQYKIPGKLLENTEFIMKVTWKHETMERPEYREISIQDPDFPWRPRIEDMSPLILQVGQETKVTCKISSYFPGNLRVTWLEKRGKTLSVLINKSSKYLIPDIEHRRMADNTYQCSPSLSFTPTSDKEDLEFLCRVEHPSLEHPIERSTGPPMINVPPQEPKNLKFTLLGSDQVLCSLSLMKFYPQIINIKWSYKERSTERNTRTLPSIKKIIQTDNEKTFDAISECTVPWKYFMSSVRVTWTHDSLKEAGYRDLSITDLPWHPVIEEIDKLPILENTEANLQYKISQYLSPSDLSVTWQKKEKNGNLTHLPKNSTKYKPNTSRPQLQPDNTYSCTTSLLITPTLLDDQGSEFICRVEHPSLKTPIERSTGPLQVCASPRNQDPIQWSLINREAVLCLRLHTFYPKYIEIKWTCSCGRFMTSKDDYEINSNSTFNLTSNCRVPLEHITHPNPTIKVTWKHDTMTDLETRKVCLGDSDFPWRPEVTELSNPVLLFGRSVTVQCEIYNFFPNNLSVMWFVKERGSQEYVPVDLRKPYKSMISQLQYSDSGYSCTASVEFTPSLSSHHGVMFMCKVKHPSLEHPIERITKPLFITLAPVLTDSVKLNPCEPEEVLCSVRLEKFFPKNINLTWTFGENKYILYTPKKTLLVDDEMETFCVISECKIPWNQLKFPVRVTWEHESMAEPQSTELLGPDFPWRPEVTELSNPVLLFGRPVTVQCEISNFFPNNLTVTWFVKERGSQEYVLVDLRKPYKSVISQLQYSDSGYSCTASLQFNPSFSSHHGVMFMCKVEHPSLEHSIERITKPLFIPSAPVVTDSVKLNPCEPEEVLCSVRLEKFFPKNINLTWTFGENEYSLYTPKKTLLVDDEVETFGVISECKIPWRQLKFPVRVTWEHESMAEPQSTELLGPDFPWCPQIEALDTPYLILNTECKIQCRISGYFPNDLTVNWFKEEEESRQLVLVTNGIKIPQPQRQPDNTYSCTASLHFTPTRMDHRLVFICKVGHPSLKEPKEERIGPLQIVGE